MSEKLPRPALNLDTYQDFVVSVQDPARYGDNWRDQFASYLEEETIEFLTDHGPSGSLFLMPSEVSIVTKPQENKRFDEQRYKIASELGDMLWYGTAIVARSGGDLALVCHQSLVSDVTESSARTIKTFSDLQEEVTGSSEQVSVTSALSHYLAESGDGRKHTSFEMNPYYVLLRTTRRLTRSLQQGKKDLSPPGITELEPVQSLKLSAGNYINTLTLIAAFRLGVDIEDIARFNMKKLEYRALHGKQNDLLFGSEDISAKPLTMT